MTQAEFINRSLEKAAWEYGKVGLLIDDSPEFLMRVARALYGGEALPKWWIPVRSIDCGASALSKVSELLDDRAFGPLRVFIVLDRYLPLRCGGGAAIAWHGGDDAETLDDEVIELNRRVADVARRASGDIEKGWSETSKCLIRFVTSFPVISARVGDAPGIVWQMRSIELLQEERRGFRKSSSWKCMLRYGPEVWARISRAGKPPDWMVETADAAQWRARTWHKTLSRLAKIIDGKRAILFTGAGSSFSAGPAGPGMLTTGKIIERVCRFIESGHEEPLPKPEIATCSCREPETVDRPVHTGDPLPENAMPIERLLAKEEHELKLEEVFSPHRHEANPGLFDRFHRCFRRELYKRDFGCAFHHWLMARFPWKAIITTNFDGFHERASASVARILSMDEEDRLWVLSLGSVGQPDDLQASSEAARGLGKSRLFKPYGSLYSPMGELALGEKDVKAFQDELEKALDMVLSDAGEGGRGALVVVGQSMRDELVKQALESLKEKLQHCELIWVDPDAYKKCRIIERGKSTTWERWVANGMEGRADELPVPGGARQIGQEACSGPVPSTALEFIYDLWAIYEDPDA